jgi:hypothetical protein
LVTGTLGTLLVLAGLIVPGHLSPVYKGWMQFGLALSKITTPIFMGIVYYLVITPSGLLKRLFSKNEMARPRTAPSYWAERAVGERHGDLKRQF